MPTPLAPLGPTTAYQGEVRKVLGGLDHTIKIEIGPGIPLAAKTAWDLRARTTWPPGLRLTVPSGPEERIVKVERRR